MRFQAMIEIGVIRNLVLLGYSIMGEIDERFIVYEIFDMDSLNSIVLAESVTESEIDEPNDFLATIFLTNHKRIDKDIFEMQKELPLWFSVVTTQGEIRNPQDMVVIANYDNIDKEKVEKCMDYVKLNCKSRD